MGRFLVYTFFVAPCVVRMHGLVSAQGARLAIVFLILPGMRKGVKGHVLFLLYAPFVGERLSEAYIPLGPFRSGAAPTG